MRETPDAAIVWHFLLRRRCVAERRNPLVPQRMFLRIQDPMVKKSLSAQRPVPPSFVVRRSS